MNLDEVRDIERVYVFKGKHLAGTITRTHDGSLFDYDKLYLERAKDEGLGSLAFHLPLEKKEHRTYGDNLHSFFAGLLPEGRRLSALISALKTSADDMFTLLAASGTDSIGDVFVSVEPTFSAKKEISSSVDVSQASFLDLFEQSIGTTEYVERVRDISVPGVQPKISAEMLSFPLSLTKRNKRYLLKLAPEKYPRLIENEHFFMQMAAQCGIECAKTQVVYDRNGTAGLLVERFDCRWRSDHQEIERIHQEDACQLLARYPQDKYRLQLREISEGICEHSSSPIIEIAKLIQLTLFSYLIANGDLHAKNISLLQEPDSRRVQLSPAYDLLSTLPYGDQKMALELEGRRNRFLPKHFIAWGGRCGVRETAVKSILAKLCLSVRHFVDRIDEIGLERKKVDFLRTTMLERVAQFEG